jgi:hypothetical protein
VKLRWVVDNWLVEDRSKMSLEIARIERLTFLNRVDEGPRLRLKLKIMLWLLVAQVTVLSLWAMFG